MNQEAEYKDKQALFIKLRKWDKVMRYIPILILLITAANQNTNAQVRHEFGLGYNYFFSHLTERSKAHGVTFRYGIESRIYKKLYFNTSFCSNLTYDYQPIYFETTTTYNVDHYVTVNRGKGGDTYHVGNLRLPVNVIIKSFGDKISVYAGPSVGVDYLFAMTSYVGSDPEMSGTGNEGKKNSPCLSFGFQAGIGYMLKDRIGFFSELKNSNNKYYRYFFTENSVLHRSSGFVIRVLQNRELSDCKSERAGFLKWLQYPIALDQ